MWHIGIYVAALVLIPIAHHWMRKWRNPRCNGRLPPGSMGLPLIGETIQFFIPSKSLDVPTFVKKRLKNYGPIFKTSLAGRPVVVSSDADFNYFIFQQEGKLVELWYMDSFAELLGLNSSLRDGLLGYVHKYLKKSVAEHFGPEILKGKVLPQLEEMASRTLDAWTRQEVLETKHACSAMILNFTSKLLFDYDHEKSKENLSETLTSITQGLMSFPLNIPGSSFHKSLQNRKKLLKMIRDMIEERQAYPETRRGDFLDHLIDDMKTNSLLTENLITYVIFALLLATSETIPTTLTLAIKLLTEHPLVKENVELICGRESSETGITWKEYKSMTFTMHVSQYVEEELNPNFVSRAEEDLQGQPPPLTKASSKRINVINEALRMSGSAGILRRTIEDVHINGYIIPKGWAILVIPSALHLNPDTFRDPLTFNPWRWKDLEANLSAKNFIPFGGGMRSCGGAEYSKVLMAVFLQALVTKYRWTKVKGGEIVRSPILGFGKGYYIEVSKNAESDQSIEG
ncbi:unnamed protein product [Dovyalis caffra]|uniref:Cytochrome P450 n=1 Tax=Dovyalis caffra TaxID=77055 RepID=A0AAV1S5V4_9ROSI|nr:unnamed protein product [Dovyalis caffra]